MKRTIMFGARCLVTCLAALLSIIPTDAQTVGDAFYIYRNDGQFNAFFRDEVDSITYSCYDLDSVYYDDYVTQVVFTPDSIYRIPLAAIDSVGFVQPDNILKQGVISLTVTILNYLVKVEGTYLYFLDSIPLSLLPKVGDKLATIEMTEIFPYGYAGKVLSVQKADGLYVVECSGLELEDVFDSYNYLIDIVPEDDNASRIRRAEKPNIDRTINIPTLSHSWSLGVGRSIFSVNNTVEASLSPKFHIKGNDMVDPKRGRLTNIRITGNYTTGVKYDFGFEVSPDPLEFPFPGGRNERPICPLLSFFWDFGMFVGVSGSITYSQTFTQQHVSHIDYQREGIKMPTISFDRPTLVGNTETERRIALYGSVRGGFYGEIGIKPWLLEKNSDLGGKVSGRLEVGIEAEMERGINLSSFDEADRNTALYDFVDNGGDLALPSLTVSPYASVTITIKVGPWDSHWTPWKGKIGSPIYEGGFFPHFSNVRYERTSGNGNINFSSDLSRTCPFPFQIGFSVFDMEGNFIKDGYYGREYSNPYSFDTYNVSIDGLKKDGEYKVYPSINVFNHRVLASPSVIVRPCPVTISDFKMTKSQYKDKGFAHEGMTYDYRYDVAVTVSIEDLEGVADWGYVYRDPNGRDKEISLKQFGTSYTDSRYAYFRNMSPATVTLMGYVRYEGSSEPVYGEPTDYTVTHADTSCPDANHPHMIDLGIGTLWACCNVGASAPEQYGGYYAWGETHEKAVYNWDTYQYGGSWDNVVNIGSDISGTQYDAATANWGAPWRMPTLDEIKKLVNNCTSTWTTENGVYGRRFTGPSRGSIFLPAAGLRWDSGLNNAGNYGYFWSSTLYGSSPYYAYFLDVYSGGAGWHYGSRGSGHTVRPVR